MAGILGRYRRLSGPCGALGLLFVLCVLVAAPAADWWALGAVGAVFAAVELVYVGFWLGVRSRTG